MNLKDLMEKTLQGKEEKEASNKETNKPQLKVTHKKKEPKQKESLNLGELSKLQELLSPQQVETVKEEVKETTATTPKEISIKDLMTQATTLEVKSEEKVEEEEVEEKVVEEVVVEEEKGEKKVEEEEVVEEETVVVEVEQSQDKVEEVEVVEEVTSINTPVEKVEVKEEKVKETKEEIEVKDKKIKPISVEGYPDLTYNKMYVGHLVLSRNNFGEAVFSEGNNTYTVLVPTAAIGAELHKLEKYRKQGNILNVSFRVYSQKNGPNNYVLVASHLLVLGTSPYNQLLKEISKNPSVLPSKPMSISSFLVAAEQISALQEPVSDVVDAMGIVGVRTNKEGEFYSLYIEEG